MLRQEHRGRDGQAAARDGPGDGVRGRVLADAARFAALLAVRWRSPAALEGLRARKLRRLVRHAHARVPYYRARMDEAGIRPEDVRSLDDLRRLPLTTKRDLRRAGDDHLSAGAGPLEILRTSGYSGEPFLVRLHRDELRLRRMRDFRAMLRAGLRARDRLVVLGPERLGPPGLHQRLGFYRLDLIRGDLPVAEQTRRLRAADPTVLWAYPSMLRSVLQHGTPLTALARPRLLISSSEVLDPGLRRQVRAHWIGEIFNFYGTMEVGRIAAECPAHSGLHVEADAIVVELLDGDRPAAPGVPGQVVVTALDQYAAPFIRYDLGDLCAAAAGPCACGWPTPLLEPPLGRSADGVMTPDGWLSVARLNFALRVEPDLWQYRFVQDTPDRVAAQLVFEHPPTPARLAELRQKLEQTLAGLPVDIEVVDAIRHSGDKFRVAVSRIRPGDPAG